MQSVTKKSRIRGVSIELKGDMELLVDFRLCECVLIVNDEIVARSPLAYMQGGANNGNRMFWWPIDYNLEDESRIRLEMRGEPRKEARTGTTIVAGLVMESTLDDWK